MTITATFHDYDQNWTEGSTTYWFILEGAPDDCDSPISFNCDLFGIVESGEDSWIINSALDLLTDSQTTRAIRSAARITDALRREVAGL